ncbi:MAG: hypothetical protein MJ195_02770 [Mycoplasmoidaceae bacterium]|nr:hypothetical protein [Mycoplasmoidaceae bacterium]
MSRGLTEYNNRLENSNVQIKSYYYNATIDNVTADEKVYGLTFDLQMDMSYDYSGTDETVMKNLGLYYYK